MTMISQTVVLLVIASDIHCVQKKTSPCVFFYNF